MAAELGVSRTPIRAALQRLQQEGYVVVPQRGQQSRMSVAPLTRDDAIELFSVISSLEGLAASWAALRPDDERAGVVKELRAVNAELYEASTVADPDVGWVFELDRRFHSRLVEAGAGPRLLALHESFKPQSERYGRIYSSALASEMPTSVDEHEAVVAHIESGNAEEAERAMRLNWENASERLARVIEDVGERGVW